MKLEPDEIEDLAKYYDEIYDGIISSEAGSKENEQLLHLHKTFMRLAYTCGIWGDIEKEIKQGKVER